MAHNSLIERVTRKFFKPKSDNQSLREAIEDLIEDHDDLDDQDNASEKDVKSAEHEKLLISNILNLQEETVEDVMIPRADIVAIDVDADQTELMALLSENQYSRIPVYKGQLDDIIGTIHIKDIIALLAQGKKVVMKELVRDIPIVSPSMPVMSLILFMKERRKHMVLVVDEYGGIDGLATIGDVIEAVIGAVEDEYDADQSDILKKQNDGSIIAEGRVDLEEFESEFGQMFSDEEHEDADTLAGLVFMLAGRVPVRGEIITHPHNGMEFEVMDADPRRINRLKIRLKEEG